MIAHDPHFVIFVHSSASVFSSKPHKWWAIAVTYMYVIAYKSQRTFSPYIPALGLAVAQDAVELPIASNTSSLSSSDLK